MPMDMNHYFLPRVQNELLKSESELAIFLWFSPFCIFSWTQSLKTIFSVLVQKSKDSFC